MVRPAVALFMLLASGAAAFAEEAPPSAPAAVDVVAIRGAPADPAAIDDLPNPPELRSRDGVLEVELTARPSWIRVAGKRFRSNVYNGLYIPPTLVLSRGDTLRMKLNNEIGPADVQFKKSVRTNMHYHGADVSPKAPGDDVFLKVKAGTSFDYVVPFPSDHPEGLHWYHPHAHGVVNKQILSGMSGMLIVDGYIEAHYPELAGLRRRVMVLKDIVLPNETATTLTLNGYTDAPVKARPGEWQVWQVGNLGANSFFKFALAGHEFWTIERDGNVLVTPERQETLFLAPGARVTVAVKAGAAGSYKLSSLNVDTGPTGLPNDAADLGTFIVAGDPKPDRGISERVQEPAANRSAIFPRPRDIKNLPITRERVFEFSDAKDFSKFYINGQIFDPNVVNTTTRVGDVERWILRNLATELHVFHLHQTSFLVQEKGVGRQPDATGLRDVITLPYAADGKPGEVSVIIPFTNPVMTGQFVYHCHLVGHEDAGMMQSIRVLPQRTAAEDAWRMFGRMLGSDEPPPWWPARAQRAARLPEANELTAALNGEICVTSDPADEREEANLWVSGRGPVTPTN
ncbi:multicopper oxidase family protein [Chenggangzhangella methanolivorans]|uniref:Multicopper oxidase family protein n=1 Tax=Chenggangzhangella methanolivorans TaxID=1437009 RepID=A0A9E6R603_9HYPH|nr:multicopper oxidase family protein [Chenggangzhangella methanolivorans]QZN98837.1 multicopper oxidase family protein [Chenggangzhangella methanolivorans]